MPPVANTSLRNTGGAPCCSGRMNDGDIGTTVPPWPDSSGTTSSAEAKLPSGSVTT